MGERVMFGIPIAGVLTQYAGSLPISDDAVFNLLEALEECQALPASMAPSAVRYPLRVINAILIELDHADPSDAAVICGQPHLAESGLADQVIRAEGPWAGEATPQMIRPFLIDITLGTHPEDAADRYRLSQDDLMHLEFLLQLEQHWHDEILNRVLMARASGWGVLGVARELGTWKPSVIWSWIKEARRVEAELRQACAK
jgi:hypothetical protein